MNPFKAKAFAWLVLCSIFALATVSAVAGDDWKPVTPAELALKTPSIDKDADAEALFWEVRVDDSDPQVLALINYVRVKIFTDRGKELYSKIDVTPDDGYQVKELAGRVIKPDGTIIDVKKEDIFERTIVKVGKAKIKAKSFAVPGIEAGVIVEYRYREVEPGGAADLDLFLQREIPVQNLSYLVRPFRGEHGMQYMPFNTPDDVKFVDDKNSYHRITMKDVPALREEPYMPPVNDIRPWVMIFYTDDQKMSADEYWKQYNKIINTNTKDGLKPNDEVKAAAAEATSGASTAEDKLVKLYDYCQAKIKNITYDTTISPDDRAKLKENVTPGDTLKRQMGTGRDIDALFAALVTAAGMEAHWAETGNRAETHFDRTVPNVHLVHRAGIAVKVGEGWRFFDPGARFVPYGMMIWYEEGQDALIVNGKDPIWAKIPLSDPDKTQEKRTGKFRLTDDGTLEGDVRVEYTGQEAALHRFENYDDSPVVQETTLRDAVKASMSTAELSDIKIENINESNKPFAYSFKIRVPGYAQKTGKRLFLQPGVFEHGDKTPFTAADRKYDIFFHYPWSEEDQVSIELPAGYDLDNAGKPAPITSEMTQGICALNINVGVSEDKKTLVYHRSFFFGGKGATYFPKTSYTGVKNLFDLIRQADDNTIVLRQKQ